MLKLSFFGAAQEVTGSCFLLEDGKQKILVDCGMFQSPRFCDVRSREAFPFDPHSIDALFVTHAHIDHTGRIPRLGQEKFQGAIYSTPPTRALAELMLKDSVGVLTKEAVHASELPLYTEADVDRVMALWRTHEYHQRISVGNFSCTLYRSGHILGSSMVWIEHDNTTLLFTGDLGNPNNPLLLRDEVPSSQVLVVDSTYGDRLHEGDQERRLKLERVIENSVMRGGVLMIPSFSLERTQEIIWEIAHMLQRKQIPNIPIFIDSPLAIAATRIYQTYEAYLNATSEDRSFSFLHVPMVRYTLTSEESKGINSVRPPKIIVAGSGMSTGGRILHHERRYLEDPKSTILFIGYQAPGSLGRLIQDGAPSVTIFGEEIPVQCHREEINGYSAHMDRKDVFEFIQQRSDTLRKMYAVHGEPKSLLALVQSVRDNLAVEAFAPHYGESVLLG